MCGRCIYFYIIRFLKAVSNTSPFPLICCASSSSGTLTHSLSRHPTQIIFLFLHSFFSSFFQFLKTNAGNPSTTFWGFSALYITRLKVRQRWIWAWVCLHVCLCGLQWVPLYPITAPKQLTKISSAVLLYYFDIYVILRCNLLKCVSVYLMMWEQITTLWHRSWLCNVCWWLAIVKYGCKLHHSQ